MYASSRRGAIRVISKEFCKKESYGGHPLTLVHRSIESVQKKKEKEKDKYDAIIARPFPPVYSTKERDIDPIK
jgi:hypothetical protein